MREKLLDIWCKALEISVDDWIKISKTEDLEIDSLTIIKFIVDVEEEFDLELDDEMLLASEGDVFEKVYNKVLEQESLC